MLQHWKKYLNSEDFCYLVDFITDTTNGIKRNNEYIIFCGDASTGKNTLMNEIINLVGSDNCATNVHKHDLQKDISTLGRVPNQELLQKLKKNLLIFQCEKKSNCHDYECFIDEIINGNPFTWSGMFDPSDSVIPGNVITITRNVDSMRYMHTRKAK